MTATVPANAVSIDLYPTQDAFVFDASRYVAFVAGRNSGKTFSGALKAYLWARRGGLGVIAAPNFPMLTHGAKRQFLDRLNSLGIDYRENKTEGWVYVYTFNAEILFATLESESRVRGPNFDWGWVDELDYLADRTVWRALKGAVRSGGAPQLFATTTPKGKRIVYDEWIVEKTPAHSLYKATTYDNPFIDADDYVSGLRYSGRFAEQEINAAFVSFDGLVYEAFDRERHVQSVDTEGWRTLLTVDVGSRNPTAILTVRVASDERVHVETEVYRRGMSSTDIIGKIEEEADRTDPDMIYIDPSAAGYIKDLQRDGYPVVKANNDVIEGIGRVTDLLEHGFTIDPSCVNTIAEFETYRYPEGSRSESDKPIKESDHALDALRYFALGESVPVAEVRIW
jgi:PBSX family phage terminase large subunit